MLDKYTFADNPKGNPLLDTDLMWIKHLFGTRSVIPRSVLIKNSDGFPSVVRMPALHDNQPLLTLFWLVDPDLVKLVDQLESNGGVRRSQQALKLGDLNLDLFRNQHLNYAKLRVESAEPNELKLINSKGYIERFSNSGIGGIRNFDTVKCLHLHLAHYLATSDNEVGKWTLNQLNNVDRFDTAI